MTVSTVMQLQKHQPGSRRFAILVGDSQGQQYIAVMAGFSSVLPTAASS